MNIYKAKCIADGYVEMMTRYCERIEIGGSIRRGNRDVKDIELVCVPLIEPGADLFGASLVESRNLLFEWAQTSGIEWIKTGTSSIVPWSIKADGKYWRGLLRSDGFLKLDVFLATRENFGTTFLIRTGSAEFNVALMRHAASIGRPCRENHFHSADDQPIDFDNEQDIFAFLNLRYVPPRERTGEGALESI